MRVNDSRPVTAGNCGNKKQSGDVLTPSPLSKHG